MQTECEALPLIEVISNCKKFVLDLKRPSMTKAVNFQNVTNIYFFIRKKENVEVCPEMDA